MHVDPQHTHIQTLTHTHLHKLIYTLQVDASTFRVVEELKRLYKLRVLPLEKMYHFEDFYTAHLTDEEFESKPQVGEGVG
jgi:hypothetical protein